MDSELLWGITLVWIGLTIPVGLCVSMMLKEISKTYDHLHESFDSLERSAEEGFKHLENTIDSTIDNIEKRMK